ncbi:hypothetical protein [Parasphingorhabdus halotolerans]|uniref:Uncharacterized protein n=1 Tax=Parasphingorhabdus halotolerans TaxID=2725558 RepID=A0A6H2DP43_9SPHN|nr:hypothetical protein [Parasphingorhabdus halotolerans]QJB69907.1 hypothetical protein HF685_11940 [Parasphingorhabdus halotolerans]
MSDVCGNRHLLSIGYDGSIERGAKAALVAAVENGSPIYVGWAFDSNSDGKDDIVHWHPAEFLSIYDEEIFTQTPRIEAQRPSNSPTNMNFREADTQWVGVIGTNGKLVGRSSDSSQAGERQVKSWWCKA